MNKNKLITLLIVAITLFAGYGTYTYSKLLQSQDELQGAYNMVTGLEIQLNAVKHTIELRPPIKRTELPSKPYPIYQPITRTHENIPH